MIPKELFSKYINLPKYLGNKTILSFIPNTIELGLEYLKKTHPTEKLWTI